MDIAVYAIFWIIVIGAVYYVPLLLISHWLDR